MAIKRFFREALIKRVVCNEIRLVLPVGAANTEAPVGPTLSQLGVNADNLCTEFNELTKNFNLINPSLLVTVKVKKVEGGFDVEIKNSTLSSSLFYSCFIFICRYFVVIYPESSRVIEELEVRPVCFCSKESECRVAKWLVVLRSIVRKPSG